MKTNEDDPAEKSNSILEVNFFEFDQHQQKQQQKNILYGNSFCLFLLKVFQCVNAYLNDAP